MVCKSAGFAGNGRIGEVFEMRGVLHDMFQEAIENNDEYNFIHIWTCNYGPTFSQWMQDFINYKYPQYKDYLDKILILK